MKKKVQIKVAPLKLQREAIRTLDADVLGQIAAGKPPRSYGGGAGCPIPVSCGDC
jgi:hypothetical protein